MAPQRAQTVTDRPRPLFDPLGVRIEEFFLYPRLELDGSYNDNIFATQSGTKSDFITDLKSRLDLVSNFGAHAFNVSAGADIGWYATHSSENYQDAFASTSGRYDIDQGQHIFANAEIDRLHIARTSPNFPNVVPGSIAAQPPIYTTYRAALGYDQDQLPVTYRGELSVARSEFQAVPAVGGGVNRNDSGVDAGFGAKFLVRRDLYRGASYTFAHRDSSGSFAGQSFSQNIFMLRVATQL